MRKDRFTDEALANVKALANAKSQDAESFAEAYDFARCQRPDGSFYGTAGQCRTGTPAKAKEQEASKTKSQVSLVTPRATTQADVDGLRKYRDEQQARVKNIGAAMAKNPDARKDPKVMKTLELAVRNVEAANTQLSKAMDDVGKQGLKSKVIQAPGADPAVMRRKELEEEKRMARMRATNERADAREKTRKEAKRRSEEDVRRPGGKLIGTSPRNMAIDGLNELKKEAADYKKKFKSRANEEMIGKVLKTYESRIAAQEKFIKDKYGDG
jgi:hypothetical protein